MASCLGLYVETGLIKYAKITKDNDNIKIDTCGVKAYDNLEEETGSQKLPISINSSEEMYNNFEVFGGLSKKDMEAAVRTEFETICVERGMRENTFESRYILAKNLSNKETIRSIYISASRADVERKNKIFSKYKLNTITPLPVAVTNLLNFTSIDNAAIVNIEETTTLTIIIQGKIYDIVKLNTSMKDIFQAINVKVNSFSKVYEICRNTNIYNPEEKSLGEEENEYLVDIMPVLYKISGELTDKLNSFEQKISKIYITGTAAVIGNVDLYFEEYNKDSKFEVLRPIFIEKSKKAPNNVKDYIEVNSAVACGLQALDIGLKQMNFRKAAVGSLKELLTMDVGGKKGGGGGIKIDLSFAGALDGIEKMLLRGTVSIVIALVVYGVSSYMIQTQIKNKDEEAQKKINEVNTQIAAVDADIEAVNAKKTEYTTLIKNLEEMSNKLTENIQTASVIPNLLNQIMYVIPKNVQVTSIVDTSGSIQIEAQAAKYEDLGYFKANLKAESVLLNISSDQRSKKRRHS